MARIVIASLLTAFGKSAMLGSMREIDPVGALWKHVDKHPNRTEAARALGIKPAYLSDLLTGRRGFSDNVLFALGLRKAIVKRAA
jgi:hypothetical protein